MHPTRRTMRRLAGALAVVAAVLAATATPALAAPAVAVTQSAPADDGVVRLSVTGAGFAATPPGIYVMFGREDAPISSQGAFQTAQYLPASSDTGARADGTFATTLEVRRAWTEGDGRETDCAVERCAVFTVKADGVPDRTQDTVTPIFLPALAATPVADLDPDEADIHTEGEGFDPAANGGNGFYVAFGPRGPNYHVDASRYQKVVQVTPNPVTPTMVKLQADGSFALDLAAVKAQYAVTARDGTVTEVDCTDEATPCQILTFAARGGAYRGFDTFTPVTFGGDLGPGPGPGPGPGTPAISVSPSSGLSPFGATTIAVTGSGFRPAEPGIYVAFGPAAGTTNAGAYQTTKWVHPGAAPSATQDVLSSTGTFSTTLTIGAAYTHGSGNRVDCTALACFVQTFAAHGSPDRTQDTAVAVGFAGAAPPAAGAPVAALAMSKLRIGARGRLRLVLTAPGRVTVKIARRVKGRAASGPASVAKRARTRWVRAKTIRFDVAQAGPVARTLRLRRGERYRIAVSVRGRDGAVVRAKPRVVRLRAAR
ncbi:hypothetical protein [Capillimicrobium parvum]|uniref:IPT/TIG domain-containing protein n=1 Tax=Capillimicrobium parvum TaxID=2884022 RepID=A0A9E6XVN7_9ACTN|nr:hypothetical protein [Capillimicrobium parvum]UGS35283.1 hypothetical protein DSM104329_01670 [Capillimicrobium parvum]